MCLFECILIIVFYKVHSNLKADCNMQVFYYLYFFSFFFFFKYVIIIITNSEVCYLGKEFITKLKFILFLGYILIFLNTSITIQIIQTTSSYCRQECRCPPCSSTTQSYRVSTADAGRPGPFSLIRSCPGWKSGLKFSGICPHLREWNWPLR